MKKTIAITVNRRKYGPFDVNMLDQNQRDIYDKLINCVADFSKDIIIAQSSSEALDYEPEDFGLGKSSFATETDGHDITDQAILIAGLLGEEGKSQIRSKDVQDRYFEEYGRKLNPTTCRKALQKCDFLIWNRKPKNQSRYTFAKNIDFEKIKEDISNKYPVLA